MTKEYEYYKSHKKKSKALDLVIRVLAPIVVVSVIILLIMAVIFRLLPMGYWN